MITTDSTNRVVGIKNSKSRLMTGETSGLNVLMVTTRYFPYMGGIETHVYEVGRRLASRGINITILTTVPLTSAPPLPEEEVIEDVRKAYTTFNLAQAALTRVKDVLSPLQVQRRALAEAAYRAGEADLTTLLLAEQDLQETQQKVIELREKAYLAYLQLLKAAGGAANAAAGPR